MFVLSTNHIWINQWSLHVCSFPQTTYGSIRVIACVFFPQTTYGHTRVIACVFFPQTTYGSTSVIACVFFPQTTYGSTSGHCMCVIFTNHIWIYQCSLHVCSCHKPLMDPPVFIACVFFSTNYIWIH